jgi:hypothetical protein
MTTPDPTPETELGAQELTDENLEEVSGGLRDRVSYNFAAAGVDVSAAAAAEPQKDPWPVT